jgi:septum formation inhibitor MinC
MIEKLDDIIAYNHDVAEFNHQEQLNNLEVLNQVNDKITEIPNIINEAKKDINFNVRTNMNMAINLLKKAFKEPFEQMAFLNSNINSISKKRILQ